MGKTGRAVVGGIYAIGAVITVVLLGIFFFRVPIVPFPDAMLPMPLWELAGNWLAMGTVPMGAATVLFLRVFPLQKGRKGLWKRAGILCPCAVCCVFLIFHIALWASAVMI